jgi:hypothetical protein
MMRVLSLGAGVQSTTMGLMAALGEITPMPDCAIFADTGWEPMAVYEHLEKLTAALPFPVHKVTAGNIRDGILAGKNTTGQKFAVVPWFVGDSGMGKRQCTREYKVTPLEKKQRELLGYKKGRRIPEKSIEVWVGISWDEMPRMKDARNKWQVNRWPLIERQMRRSDCLTWLAQHGWTAPKSSCLGCPFHSDAQWREIKQNPDEWADVVEIDRALRHNGTTTRGRKSLQYMHRSCKPIEDVDLLSAEDRGQLNMFHDECDGICGT